MRMKMHLYSQVVIYPIRTLKLDELQFIIGFYLICHLYTAANSDSFDLYVKHV